MAAVAACGLFATSKVLTSKEKTLSSNQDALATLKDRIVAEDSKAKDVQIAQARGAAAEALERAVRERLALASLGRPRGLNQPHTSRNLGEALKSFGPMRFDVAVNDEPEPKNLLGPIEVALRSVGWEEIDWTGRQAVDTDSDRKGSSLAALVDLNDIIIAIHPDQAVRLWEPAKALAAALNRESLIAKAEKNLPSNVNNDNENAIHILIGRKRP